MSKLKLHLDADCSQRAVHENLLRLGHDVTRTPNDWMPLDASDETQLLGAMAQGRAIFTFNIRDFATLAQKHPGHMGIVLAAQEQWRDLGKLILALDRMLREADPQDLAGQVRWLKQWRQ
ncbi:MAG: DUF5615 family PIN-like protein [Anaerolineae bacterium]